MAQAQPEQRAELDKVGLHLLLVYQNGGEEGLKAVRESAVARDRGFRKLEELFEERANNALFHVGGILKINEKKGMSQEQQVELEKQLSRELEQLSVLQHTVHSLVFNLAPTSQAFALEKRAEKLSDEMGKNSSSNALDTMSPAAVKRSAETSKKVDQIFEELKRLPSLPPKQVQQEYDAFPEARLYQKNTSIDRKKDYNYYASWFCQTFSSSARSRDGSSLHATVKRTSCLVLSPPALACWDS